MTRRLVIAAWLVMLVLPVISLAATWLSIQYAEDVEAMILGVFVVWTLATALVIFLVVRAEVRSVKATAPRVAGYEVYGEHCPRCYATNVVSVRTQGYYHCGTCRFDFPVIKVAA